MVLGTAKAAFSDDNFRGEAAVNLTAAVFTPGTCQLGTSGIQAQGDTTTYWRVTYAGEAFNNGFTTACGQESTTVTFKFVQ